MDTSALREFAFKKLQEARERGTELAAVTAARAASSISSSVPVSSSSSSVLRARLSSNTISCQCRWRRSSRRLVKTSNDSLRATLAGTSNGTLDESIYKLDLINESLAFSIENIQEGSHVMKLLNRQLKDSAALQNTAHRAFYQRNEQSAQ
ncbi:hypothetical protein GQ600_17530 [Phytophthora cactorum]|nr:hypothetical protein GQ600_17530 [Phytophthora cactorum]